MKAIIVTIFCLFQSAANAEGLLVQDLYIRLLMPNVKVTAAYVELINQSKKDFTLVKIESDMADKVEIHNHIEKDGMMKMVEVKSVEIKAGKVLVMKPGSYHIMLIGLKDQLKLNQKHKMKFIFSDKSVIEKQAVVRSVNNTKTTPPKHHHPVKQ